MTGYDLKKVFADSVALHWSGNNNQIYTTLVELHRSGLVSRETEHQETRPDRKIYSITESGLSELDEWLLAEPELPQLRHPFLVQMQWFDRLSKDQVGTLIDRYEHELLMRLMLYKGEKARLETKSPVRTAREAYLSGMVLENLAGLYRHELDWVRSLRQGLQQFSD